jgi:hypothetical protein
MGCGGRAPVASTRLAVGSPEVASWIQVAGSPLVREASPIAEDLARGRAVLFGGWGPGANGAVPLADTWEWDGAAWHQVSTTGPDPRSAHGLVFDAARGVTVLFGGFSASNQQLDDTWEWNGTTWTPQMVTGPEGRHRFGMVYDSGAARTILFSGDPFYGSPGDTWVWDGMAWSALTTVGDPAGRRGAAMVYDVARNRTVLFGGEDVGGLRGDLWELDGATWSQPPIVGKAPSARKDAAMMFDSARGVSVLYGGVDNTGTILSDIWEWNGATWTPVSNNGGPGPRTLHGLVYQPANASWLLFGGTRSFSFPFEGGTWQSLGDGNWTRVDSLTPFPREELAMVYDSQRGAAVLFGGFGYIPTETLFNDTWLWNGASWSSLAVPSPPPAREQPGMVYDSNRDRTVLFGGNSAIGAVLEDTWELSGNVWTQISSVGPVPTRSDFAIGYDPVRAVTVLFGGWSSGQGRLGDLWLWDGAAWTQPSPSPSPGPLAREGASFSFDAAAGGLLLFGGGNTSGLQNDTWILDAAGWHRQLVPGPPPRMHGGLVWDSVRQRTLLFGGDGGGSDFGDTWEWYGGGWTQTSSSGPAARTQTAFVFDSLRGRAVLFGGQDYFVLPTLGDTWEYHGGGQPCRNGGDCDTGFCVDGVCCVQSSCGICQSCNGIDTGACGPVFNAADPDSCAVPATCGPTAHCGAADGQICSVDSDCASIHCVDHVCCHSACTAACAVCSRAAGAVADGVCSMAPAGFLGRPACGAYACSGQSLVCDATNCTADLYCGTGYYCAANGTCVTQRSLTASCDSRAGKDCLVGGCRVCATAGGCVDNTCCATACDGGCHVCARLLGATADGVCTLAAKGFSGAPGCGAYVCDGVQAECPSLCSGSDSSLCASGLTCVEGQCTGFLGNGVACIANSQCLSTNCVDGFCCDSSCEGPCAACNLKGSEGKCTLVAAGENPRHLCGGEGACAATCDGAGSCLFPSLGTHCDVCKACNGGGRCSELPPSGDDDLCPTISCSARSSECRHYQDLTTQRCTSPGVCALPNDPDRCTHFTDADDGTPCSEGVCASGACSLPPDLGRKGQSTGQGCDLSSSGSSGRGLFVALMALAVLAIARVRRHVSLRG